MKIGENLRALRADSGMTQEQVAEKLGVTRQALSSYESNRTRPDIDTLVRLCGIYGTDLDGLVYGHTRVLRALRRVKTAAYVLWALLVGLTLLSSALLWFANRFFPLSPGPVTQAELSVLKAHTGLTTAWERGDQAILTMAFLGFAALLVLILAGGCRIPLQQKLLYLAVLGAGLVLAALPFALADPVFTVVDHLITPVHVVVRMLLFFAVLLTAEKVRDRKADTEQT